MSDNNDAAFESLGDMFYECLHRDKIFQYLDDTNETTTFSDILKWSVRTAINLKKLGISRQDIICSCSHTQKYSTVPFIAAQYLGAVSNTFDPNLSHLDTIYLLKLVQPKIMFVSVESLNFIEHCLEKSGVSTEIVIFGPSDKYRQFSEFLEVSKEEEESFQIEHIENNTDISLILFTSGTTGFPKGVCMSHKTLLKDIRKPKVLSNDVKLVTMLYPSLYWISTTFSLISSIRFGYSTVVRVNFDPEYTWRLIEKYKISSIYLVPYQGVEFVSNKPVDVDTSSLQLFLTGGSMVPVTLMNKLKELFPNTIIIKIYSQTEAAGRITAFSPEDHELQFKKPQSCGKVDKSLQWKVVDVNTEKLLGANERGELRIKSGYIPTTYYKIDSSSAFDSEGYLKTGDLVYYDEDEYFYIVGRLKEMYKCRGWHILPNLIEDILLSHSAVKEAAVIGIPHETDGEHPMAVVVLFQEFDKNCAEEILEFVNGKVVDNQKLRAGVKIVDSLPKTTTGKIKRGDLIKMIMEMIEKK